MAEAAVHFVESMDVTIADCEFRQTGAWGLGLTRGTSYTTVSRNRFFDTSGGGVYLGNVNETRSNSSAPRPTELSVTDNTIINTGVEYQGSSGIHLFSAVDTTIAHNRLIHIPYTAITFVWPVPQGDSFNRNLSLVGNDVSDPSYWGEDGGAVHTLALCLDCVIERNYFHNQSHGSKCTYIDNGSSGYNISDHVVDHANKSLWLYYQQSCNPRCPYLGPSKYAQPYVGCNATAHDKCCCNAGDNNHAARCYVRASLDDPFPIQNITSLTRVADDAPFPPAAQKIIAAAGPRPVVGGGCGVF